MQVDTALKKELEDHKSTCVLTYEHMAKYKGEYQFDLSGFFNIWFSNDASSFMPALIKYRLIRTRSNNPDLRLTLVYSSACLDAKTRCELIAFACNLNLTLVDFDHDLPGLLSSALDKQLYEIAKEEISKAHSKQGGSMAAASDIVRLFLPLHAAYGNYADLETEFKLSGKPKEIVGFSPILLNGGIAAIKDAGGILTLPNLTNDIILVARVGMDNTGILSGVAEMLDRIKRVQLKHYRAFDLDALLGYHGDDINHTLVEMMKRRVAESILSRMPTPTRNQFQRQLEQGLIDLDGLIRDSRYNEVVQWLAQSNHNIYSFRLMVQSAIQRSAHKDAYYKELYKSTVMYITGPQILLAMYDHSDRAKAEQNLGLVIESHFAGLATNKLDQYIITTNSTMVIENEYNNKPVHDIKVGNDSAWLNEGWLEILKASDEIDRAAKTIHNAWAMWKVRPKVWEINPEIRPLVKTQILNSIPMLT